VLLPTTPVRIDARLRLRSAKPVRARACGAESAPISARRTREPAALYGPLLAAARRA
jgi:hypothetical protein